MEITQKYMSKEQAAKALGKLSPRRVLELAKEGQLESARVRDPNTNHTVVRIAAQSIVEYLERKKAQIPIPDPVEGSVAIAPAAARAIAPRGIHSNGAIAHATAHQYVRLVERIFLTIGEAVEYTGLGAGCLRRRVADGKLNLIKGDGPHGADVLRRADLDKL